MTARHRGRRGARPARREGEEYREYSADEQRRGTGCIVGFFKEAGYTNNEILMIATRGGGEILGIPDKLGTLEKAKLADVLVVVGDPLQDIENLRKMRLVIADGRVVRDRVTRADTSSASRP